MIGSGLGGGPVDQREARDRREVGRPRQLSRPSANVNASFGLYLFNADPDFITEALAGGIEGVVVDWERAGKRSRQAGFDTQIRGDTVADLARVRRETSAKILCRINNDPARLACEIEMAIDNGADELLLPMVRSTAEVERALDLDDGRRPLGILVETEAAVHQAAALARLDVSRVYVGLNDLSIERGSASIFEAVVDGTVAAVRASFADVPFGFGGLTLPGHGRPIATELLAGEMARLGADFTFLRRSFLRDLGDRPVGEGLAEIRVMLAAAGRRDGPRIDADRRDLRGRVSATGAPA